HNDVMLSERGIRTYATPYRFPPDLSAIPGRTQMTPLPVIVDPSHAAGRRALVPSLSYAAAAAGADGVIVEVHPEPEEAVCDGPQALRAGDFAAYAQTLNRAAQLAGKRSFLPEEAPAA
ncbi:MAG: 3-deoxy-7-phosphoheptulonate synthase, partial [Solirubrobacterales bacterium]